MMIQQKPPNFIVDEEAEDFEDIIEFNNYFYFIYISPQNFKVLANHQKMLLVTQFYYEILIL